MVSGIKVIGLLFGPLPQELLFRWMVLYRWLMLGLTSNYISTQIINILKFLEVAVDDRLCVTRDA